MGISEMPCLLFAAQSVCLQILGHRCAGFVFARACVLFPCQASPENTIGSRLLFHGIGTWRLLVLLPTSQSDGINQSINSFPELHTHLHPHHPCRPIKSPAISVPLQGDGPRGPLRFFVRLVLPRTPLNCSISAPIRFPTCTDAHLPRPFQAVRESYFC
ncbi:hypothetical protein BKA64DRAFT_282741 [Cadophora sp. MPI-SDFR-AT-0126]|nr:hypothetical protein BKA64DRAFT_282741 [Leotiomycetes sp. MPI-SDFR-AT-0126]